MYGWLQRFVDEEQMIKGLHGEVPGTNDHYLIEMIFIYT
jgi:hypothetical protein